MDVTVLAEGDGEILGSGPYQLRFLAQSPDQPIAITENSVPPHFPGPVRHRHVHMTDIFYVLEGTLTLHVNGGEHLLGPGGFALVPSGVVHTFSNNGNAPARFLNIYQPSGNEQYLKEVGQRIAAGSPPSKAEMAAIAARYDFVPVHEDE
jgi:mannose-6-phosphate isomerase-like protein (cupin superfamily)